MTGLDQLPGKLGDLGPARAGQQRVLCRRRADRARSGTEQRDRGTLPRRHHDCSSGERQAAVGARVFDERHPRAGHRGGTAISTAVRRAAIAVVIAPRNNSPPSACARRSPTAGRNRASRAARATGSSALRIGVGDRASDRPAAADRGMTHHAHGLGEQRPALLQRVDERSSVACRVSAPIRSSPSEQRT